MGIVLGLVIYSMHFKVRDLLRCFYGMYIITFCISSPVLQVWDSSSGACQHTLGPGSDDGSVGHKKKISAMTVNELQPCKHLALAGDSICAYWYEL